ncbi:hypothetical protein SAMN05216312_103380 [Cohnella sp. OV330]|uniref:hypothetical protein n=1 Tax=Cohnella sp. OV330 TaxID=1855288 RepID=UPI0008ECF124|nr:hypothetical protein [Cohnella sp. OV330]SFB07880.1 hypothetical protein SAMN05216312_103380 [Cohnella sp. OV330]
MSTTSQARLSQWDALLVESLRSLGWSNEELFARVRSGELPVDESPFQFKYEALSAFAAEEPETFEAAVTQGYQIKYNTVRGIHSWIRVALGLEPELLLEAGAEAVRASLSTDEKARLASVLSFGWRVREEEEKAAEVSGEGRSVYVIEPIQR